MAEKLQLARTWQCGQPISNLHYDYGKTVTFKNTISDSLKLQPYSGRNVYIIIILIIIIRSPSSSTPTRDRHVTCSTAGCGIQCIILRATFKL